MFGRLYTDNELIIASVARNMKQRCNNPNAIGYKHYGGRGIQFRFESVLAATKYIHTELGPRPSNEYSVDRKNNDGHYEPGNLRWATRTEQNQNKRRYAGAVYGDRLAKLRQDRPDYSYEGLRTLIKQGLTDADIIARPKPKSGRPKNTRPNV